MKRLTIRNTFEQTHFLQEFPHLHILSLCYFVKYYWRNLTHFVSVILFAHVGSYCHDQRISCWKISSSTRRASSFVSLKEVRWKFEFTVLGRKVTKNDHRSCQVKHIFGYLVSTLICFKFTSSMIQTLFQDFYETIRQQNYHYVTECIMKHSYNVIIYLTKINQFDDVNKLQAS